MEGLSGRDALFANGSGPLYSDLLVFGDGPLAGRFRLRSLPAVCGLKPGELRLPSLEN